MVSQPFVPVNNALMLLLLLLLVTISSVEAVTITGYPASSRCRAGQQLVCQNLRDGECCDFVQNNQAVQGVLFANIRAGQWMTTHNPQATSGCGDIRERRQMVHRAPKTYRCLSGNGITGAKWHRTVPAELRQDTTSQNTTACIRTVKPVVMTWNSTLQAYTEMQ